MLRGMKGGLVYCKSKTARVRCCGKRVEKEREECRLDGMDWRKEVTARDSVPMFVSWSAGGHGGHTTES